MINENMLSLDKEKLIIRELSEQAKILKSKYGNDNVYDFSIGNPNVPCPLDVNNKLIELIKNVDPISLHSYTSAQGDKDVRKAISSYINKTYNANTNENYIYLTSGSAFGLTITLKALTSGSIDDEVIIFAPCFPEYYVYIKNANAKPVAVNPDTDTFYPDLSDFENKINKNTSIVIIDSPNNPTGIIYTEDVIKRICDILYKKEKEFNHPIYILSDEPYRELIYDGSKYPFITNYYDNSIVTYSFSKSLSLPGERIGYILVNPKANNVNDVYSAICGAGRSLGHICANSLFQLLIPHILGMTSDISIYKNNCILFEKELTNIGYEVLKPKGAFYLFVKTLCDDDNEFSQKALEYNLLLVPSESFGIKGYVRIAYCVQKEQIINSLPKFKELYNYYKESND